MPRQVRLRIHWDELEVSGYTNSLTQGRVAATGKDEMWIGPGFYEEAQAISVLTGLPLEEVVAGILNHEELHYVLEKFIGLEGYKLWLYPDATTGLDYAVRKWFTQTVEKFGMQIEIKHDIKMGI